VFPKSIPHYGEMLSDNEEALYLSEAEIIIYIWHNWHCWWGKSYDNSVNSLIIASWRRIEGTKGYEGVQQLLCEAQS